MKTAAFCVLTLAAAGIASAQTPEAVQIRVGSKLFTESVILGEIVVHLARQQGAVVEHRDQLGGTQVLWKALISGELDVYPDYTGTIAEETLAGLDLPDDDAIREALAEYSVLMAGPLGFNNTYAIGMQKDVAAELGITKISDLRKHPDLAFGFGTEFMEREDGWPNLSAAYKLTQANVRGMEHELTYRGLDSGAIQAMDLYSTDAEIGYYDLLVLDDDLTFFPKYNAVYLYRADLAERAPGLVQDLHRLEGRIPESTMIAMNGQSKLEQVPDTVVAARFVQETFGIETSVKTETRFDRLLKHTREHLFLVSLSVIAAVCLAVPLGVLAAKSRLAGQAILSTVGILQTIPSLALFVVLIPLLGIGPAPAICALFLYSLLPIVRNTYTGLHDIPPQIHESAEALGLPAAARVRLIELPLASRSILAGIKTAVVINVGTATLGGFIGAGGYGQPIFKGIRLDRTDFLLEGAIPAAVMALLAQGVFELAERRLVPRGLRLKPSA